MSIEKVVIIGRGALGIMYGEALARKIGFRSVAFLADAERVHLYRSQQVLSNNRLCPFRYETAESYRDTADLVLFAVKGTQLEEAISIARPVVRPDTVIVSVLNGIVSEEIIEERLGSGRVVWSVAQGMDALKRGTQLVYSHIGELCLGLHPRGAALPARRGHHAQDVGQVDAQRRLQPDGDGRQGRLFLRPEAGARARPHDRRHARGSDAGPGKRHLHHRG